MTKRNLKGLTIDELRSFVEEIGQPSYRANQIFYWIYNRGATDFQRMTDLSKSLRERLNEIGYIENLKVITKQVSPRDHTMKFLFELFDGLKIESVLIPSNPNSNGEENRLTLCISTQVGCPLDCKFCATGTMGFERNLTTSEIVDQVLQARRESPRKITNLVYMGMGEPLMNYANVMKSVEIITNEQSMGISAKRITVSTAGWAEKIYQMADEQRKVKLAVSLHTLENKTRTDLMPINKKFDLEKLLAAVEYYYQKTKQRVTYEYILFEGINDCEEDIQKLTTLAKRIPCKINLLRFHSIEFTHPAGLAARLRPTSQRRMEQFVEALRAANITVMVRSNAGEDIDAACGQLAIKN